MFKTELLNYEIYIRLRARNGTVAFRICLLLYPFLFFGSSGCWLGLGSGTAAAFEFLWLQQGLFQGSITICWKGNVCPGHVPCARAVNYPLQPHEETRRPRRRLGLCWTVGSGLRKGELLQLWGFLSAVAPRGGRTDSVVLP